MRRFGAEILDGERAGADAPTPRRPRRRRLRRALMVVGVLFVCLAAVVLRYAFAKPCPRPEFRAEYQAKFGGPTDCKLDARPIVDEVGERLNEIYGGVVTDESDRNRVILDFLYDPNQTDPVDETERLRSLARRFVDEARESGVFGRIDQIAAADGYHRPPPSGALIEWMAPDLGYARHIARVNRVRMLDSAAKGEWDEFLRAYESSLALTRWISTRGTMLEMLLAGAILQLADTELRCALLEREPEAAVLRQIVEARKRQEVRHFSAKPGLDGERMVILDAFDSIHTRGGTLLLSETTKLGGQADFFGIPAAHVRWVNFGGLFLASKADSVAFVNRVFSRYDSIDEPAYKRLNEAALFDDDHDVPKWNLAVGILMPAFKKSVRAVDATRTYIVGTDVMIALATFRATHDGYPAELRDLHDAEINDPLTGQPFGYRKLDSAADPFHRPYLLYSFGRDRVDDGGTSPKKRSKDFELFDADPDSGLDVVIDRSRSEP